MALPELMVSVLLLGLLSLMVFAIFFSGMRAWRVSDTQRDLVEGSRVALAHLGQEIQRSSYASLSLQPDAVSFLSAVDEQGVFALGPLGEPLWQNFVVYFRDPGNEELHRTEVALTATPTPLTIEAWGSQPLSYYLTGGRLLIPHVRLFAPSVPAGRRLDYRWDLEWVRGGGLPPIRFTMAGTTRFRNP